MKRLIISVLSILAFLTSCGPTRYGLNVEMRYPSKSGVDLAGKVLSIVYLENSDSDALAFNAGMAESFASVLESDYGTGEGSVGVYKMSPVNAASYAVKDSLINLLVDTGADVVFLMDTVKLGTLRSASKMTPFTVTLYCFDGMDASENIYAYSGTSNVRLGGSTSVEEEGKTVGIQLSSTFKSQWRHEQYSIMYFETEKWYDALELAANYNWTGAMKIWFELLSARDMLKRSCAEYNIAVACYMMGDFDLATAWLDRSDNDTKLAQSESLRKRINARRR